MYINFLTGFVSQWAPYKDSTVWLDGASVIYAVFIAGCIGHLVHVAVQCACLKACTLSYSNMLCLFISRDPILQFHKELYSHNLFPCKEMAHFVTVRIYDRKLFIILATVSGKKVTSVTKGLE